MLDAQVANVAVVMVRGRWGDVVGGYDGWQVTEPGRWLNVLNSSTVQGMGSPILFGHETLSWIPILGTCQTASMIF